jgi:transposase-like protein
LEGCRPYLSIDSTTLNGRWNGQLVAATSVDGHNWIYPVAYGFISSEAEADWTWFMEQLQKAIDNLPVLAISSDACKGLENAVKKVFPNAKQRECFFHLTKNFMKKFRRFGQLSPAARAYREDIFYEKIASIIFESPEPVQWLQKNHKLLWYRCAFNPEIKCDYITNNISVIQ